jgi:hypothetical protein
VPESFQLIAPLIRTRGVLDTKRPSAASSSLRPSPPCSAASASVVPSTTIAAARRPSRPRTRAHDLQIATWRGVSRRQRHQSRPSRQRSLSATTLTRVSSSARRVFLPLHQPSLDLRSRRRDQSLRRHLSPDSLPAQDRSGPRGTDVHQMGWLLKACCRLELTAAALR